jgi:predicted enzyme related to lactoylglutathione lyase
LIALDRCQLPPEGRIVSVGGARIRNVTPEQPKPMTTGPSALLRAVDCITVPVPDLDSGLAFYRGALGHPLLWRNDEVGQAAVGLPEGETELVLTTRQGYAPGWLVASADQAAETIRSAGGRVVTEACDSPVGRIAVTADPFGNVLVLLDLSKGRYITDVSGIVTGTAASPSTAEHSE